MPETSKISIKKPKLLIVEGADEERLIGAACSGFNLDIQIEGIGGKTKIAANLKLLVRDPEFSRLRALAVIRDADASPTSALQAVQDALRNAELPAPDAHARFVGTVPRVGIFIMPDGANSGCLETLCLASVASEPGFSCLGDYFACLAAAGVVPGEMDKARTHAWLASRPGPDLRVGESAQARYWDFNHSVFEPLWSFLRQM